MGTCQGRRAIRCDDGVGLRLLGHGQALQDLLEARI